MWRGGGTDTTPYRHCAAQMAVGQRNPLTESLTEDTEGYLKRTLDF